LAVLYNDQSIAENWSLYVSFSEFLQDEFKEFRTTILPTTEVYRRFRTVIVNLVLCTDIASPERTQIGKSKWKEAFGDPFETVERKLQAANSPAGNAYRNADSPGFQGKTLLLSNNNRGSAINTISAKNLDQSTSGTSLGGDFDLMDGGSLSGTPESSESTDDANARHYAAQIIKEVKQTSGNKLERRMSSSAHTSTSKYRQRLGILRTVDLSGETLEAYDRRGSAHLSSGASVEPSIAPSVYSEAADDPDDLKAAVIMETIMTAADVAHNLQSWQHMVRFSFVVVIVVGVSCFV